VQERVERTGAFAGERNRYSPGKSEFLGRPSRESNYTFAKRPSINTPFVYRVIFHPFLDMNPIESPIASDLESAQFALFQKPVDGPATNL